MEFRLQPLFVFLTLIIGVVVASSHAALPSEVYWKSVLPNTPMPVAIRDMLQPEDKSTAVGVGKGGVTVKTGKGGKPGGGTSVSVGKGKGVGVSTGKPGHGTNVGVGKGGVTVHTGPKKKPVYVGVKPGPNPFVYNYAATEDQLHDNPNVALFFLEKDLIAGNEMNLQFTKTTTTSNDVLLPRAIAESIPFSSTKFPEILNRFAVKPNSAEAESMKNTIKECEDRARLAEEDKYCATSLESMVDFSTSMLVGREKSGSVQVVSTEVVGTTENDTRYRKYVIAKEVTRLGNKEAVVCHKQDYVYAVFYCHNTHTTRTYVVPLVSVDGMKKVVKAVAVCHTDTKSWNPKHLAFQVLKVKPGTVPICHFLPEDHIVWVAANN